MTDVHSLTTDLTSEGLRQLAIHSGNTHLPLDKLRQIIAHGRLTRQYAMERGLDVSDASLAAQDTLGIKPVKPENVAAYIAALQDAPPITIVRPQDVGSDGYCDHDGGCRARATKVVVSGGSPEMWDGGAPACLAFLCDAHVNAEPIAQREHVEHNAQGIAHPAAHQLWNRLLEHYPTPLTLA